MEFVEPNESPAHLQLRALARSAPAACEESVRDLLYEINAHQDLRALTLVCQNIREILEVARSTWTGDPVVSQLDTWDVPLIWIESIESELPTAVGKQLAAGFEVTKKAAAAVDIGKNPAEDSGKEPAAGVDKEAKHPLKGKGFGRFPVYSALCNSYEGDDENRKRDYRLLQAHLLIAQVKLMRKHASRPAYEVYKGEKELLSGVAYSNSAAFEVRSLSKQPELLKALHTDVTPAEFASYLRSPSTDKPGPVPNRVLERLALYFEKAYGRREQAEGSSVPHWGPGNRLWVSGGRTHFKFMVLQSQFMSDSGGKKGKHTTQKRIPLNRKEVDALLDLDDDPLEDGDETGEEADSTEFDDSKADDEPGDFQEVSKAWANHVEMANQIFPWSYGILIPQELRNIIVDSPREMLSLARAGTLTKKDLLKLEVLTLIQVMFWTASTVERAQRIKVLDTPLSEEFGDLALYPGSEDDYPRWRIRAPLPDYKTPPQKLEKHQNRSQTIFLDLPVASSVLDLVSELTKQRLSLRTNSDDFLTKGPSNLHSAVCEGRSRTCNAIYLLGFGPRGIG